MIILSPPLGNSDRRTMDETHLDVNALSYVNHAVKLFGTSKTWRLTTEVKYIVIFQIET